MNLFQILTDKHATPLRILDSFFGFDSKPYFDCDPLGDIWQNMIVSINKSDVRTNFFRLFESALVCDEDTADIFWTQFEMFGELLPIYTEDNEKLYVINIIENYNALIKQASVWNNCNEVLEYVFHAKRVGHDASIFKTPENNFRDIFTNYIPYSLIQEGELYEDFYQLYHQHKLTGLMFKKIKCS
jgi:hypothetical protein